MSYRYRVDPSHRAQVWAMAVCAVLGGQKARTVAQAAAAADEVLVLLDERAKAGKFDVQEEPPP
jgi:hypothetical protein